jgi:hypothetical protein
MHAACLRLFCSINKVRKGEKAMATQSTSLPYIQPSTLEALSEEKQLTRNWINYGPIAGILAFLAYISAIDPIPFPETVKMYLGIAFGPLISVCFVGLYHFFKLHRITVTLQAATIFGIIAGTLVNLMIVVQSAIRLTIPASARESLGLAYAGLNMVQLGIDVTWDIYFSLATILLGLVMFGHPRFGKFWGAITLLIGTGLLALNLATFPTPPANAHSYDLGPASGVLFLLITIRVLTSLKWADAILRG